MIEVTSGVKHSPTRNSNCERTGSVQSGEILVAAPGQTEASVMLSPKIELTSYRLEAYKVLKHKLVIAQTTVDEAL